MAKIIFHPTDKLNAAEKLLLGGAPESGENQKTRNTYEAVVENFRLWAAEFCADDYDRDEQTRRTAAAEYLEARITGDISFMDAVGETKTLKQFGGSGAACQIVLSAFKKTEITDLPPNVRKAILRRIAKNHPGYIANQAPPIPFWEIKRYIAAHGNYDWAKNTATAHKAARNYAMVLTGYTLLLRAQSLVELRPTNIGIDEIGFPQRLTIAPIKGQISPSNVSFYTNTDSAELAEILGHAKFALKNWMEIRARRHNSESGYLFCQYSGKKLADSETVSRIVRAEFGRKELTSHSLRRGGTATRAQFGETEVVIRRISGRQNNPFRRHEERIHAENSALQTLPDYAALETKQNKLSEELIAAVAAGNIVRVKQLLDNGASADYNKNAPLRLAVCGPDNKTHIKNRIEIAEALLGAGADPNGDELREWNDSGDYYCVGETFLDALLYQAYHSNNYEEENMVELFKKFGAQTSAERDANTDI